MFEGVTDIELRHTSGTKFHLANGEKCLAFGHSVYVTLAVIGKKLIIITDEADEVTEG